MSPAIKPRILVVEDEVRLAKFLELDLQAEGYQVSVAHDGMTGLQMAETDSPDVILLDWMLPELSGLDVCRRLRAKGCRIPIIFVTAMDTDEDRLTGMAAGATDYLVKPFQFGELLSKIAQ